MPDPIDIFMEDSKRLIGGSVEDLRSALGCAAFNGRLVEMEGDICIAYALAMKGKQTTKASVCMRHLKIIDAIRKSQIANRK